MNKKGKKLFIFLSSFFVICLIFYFVFYASKDFNLEFASAFSNSEEKKEIINEQKNEKEENKNNEFNSLVKKIKANLQEKYFITSKLPVDNSPQKCKQAQDCDLDCRFAAAIDSKTKTLLYEKNAYQPTPIASITKLMTALVFLDYNPGWNKVYQIKASDRRDGGRIYLYQGEKVKVKDLFYASLIGSANTATIALIKSTGMTEEEFVMKMNEKASKLGLEKTIFIDPTGLLDGNISTAHEVSLLAREALAQKDIRQATLVKDYQFKTLSGRLKNIISTDHLLGNLPPNGIRILGGKTGYTVAAGFCFVGEFVHEGENEIISVVLGGPSYSGRFTETKLLVEWIYNNYRWPEIGEN